MKYTVGKEKQYFLDNDSNRVMLQLEGLFDFPEKACEVISSRHAIRQFWCSTQNIEYFHIVVPNKETVLKHYLPDNIAFEKHGPRPIVKYLNFTKSHKINTFYRSELLEEKNLLDKYYYRTDSHWTTKGAVQYLRCFLELYLPTLFDTASTLEYETRRLQFAGDLGCHLGDSEEIEDIFLSQDNFKILFEGKLTNEGHVWHTCSKVKTSGGKAIILHDSFTHSLFSTISTLFSETLFIHSPDLDLSLIRKFGPDVIIFIQAERFLPRYISNELYVEPWLRDLALKKNPQDRTAEYFAKLESLSSKDAQ
ncbi:alginate O-acetyltransferase AlgX-related protein [Methylobacterium haplocladii]|nr:hypothetical protein [Methylobacterium haplocladii]GJD86477.1 hypothetical protein HPGCJGGD_4384 [Methylobacterium haplocladii]